MIGRDPQATERHAQRARNRSADRNLYGETIARKQFQSPLKGELFRMTRWSLSTHDHESLDFFDDEVADPAVGGLPNLRFHPLRQARRRAEAIQRHGVVLPGSAQ
jgi:hypothetical protein